MKRGFKNIKYDIPVCKIQNMMFILSHAQVISD